MKIKLKNKKVVILITVLVIILILVGGYYFLINKDKPKKPDSSPCLGENEWAIHSVSEHYYSSEEPIVRQNPVSIAIRDKNTKETIFEFQVNNVDIKHYASPQHGIELHKCGVYVLRLFNYDFEKMKQGPGYRDEIWKYEYNGEGNSLLLLSEKDAEGIFRPYFSKVFTIDETEIYVALIRSWYGEPKNHALVIKNLKTMEDEWVITLKELIENYKIDVGTIQISGWYKNIFQFEVLNSDNPWFNLYIDTKKIEKTS